MKFNGGSSASDARGIWCCAFENLKLIRTWAKDQAPGPTDNLTRLRSSDFSARRYARGLGRADRRVRESMCEVC